VEGPQYQAELLQQQSSALPSPSSLPRRSSLSSTPNPPARRKRIQGAYSRCQQSNSGSTTAIPIPVSSKSHSRLPAGSPKPRSSISANIRAMKKLVHCIGDCISCINSLWGGQ
jgi:hypothetical protein